MDTRRIMGGGCKIRDDSILRGEPQARGIAQYPTLRVGFIPDIYCDWR